MNYRRIYNELIMKAWRRGGVKGYKEKHHIIPRCQGGGNDKANLVELTASEHYIAHLLLAKMHPNNHKIIVPIILMAGNIGVNNKIVANMREKTAEFHRGRKRSKETCAKISEATKRSFRNNPERAKEIAKRNSERIVSDETRAKISEISKGKTPMLGKTHTKEAKAKISKALIGNQYALGMKHNKEARAKMSTSHKGKKRSPESIAKMCTTKAKNKERKELLQFWCAL